MGSVAYYAIKAVAKLTGFTLDHRQGVTSRRKLNQHAVRYTFSDGSEAIIHTTKSYAVVPGELVTELRINK